MSARTVIAAITATALVACSSGPDLSPAPQEPGDSSSQSSLNVPFDLGYGRTVSLTDLSLQITFAEVLEDARCPSDTTCVWEGIAVVRLKVTSGADSASVVLDTSQSPVAAPGGYQIQLEELSPYPESAQSGIEPTLYKVRLKVSQP